MVLLTHAESTPLLALKGAVVGTTLFVAGSLATTSLQSLPALILAAQQKESAPPSSKQPSNNAGPATGYKLAAKQFKIMSDSALITQVPPELLTIMASGFLTYHYRHCSGLEWQRWAAVSALVASLFPWSAVLMKPIVYKIGRLAGEEGEDAPLDREVDRTEAESLIRQLSNRNLVRAGLMTAAGAVGLWSLLG